MKYVIILFMLVCFGCSDWLDVKPSDRVAESTAFSTVAGFKQALNGIYIEMNTEALYGSSLTCEMVEILAQRYDINQENTTAYAFSQFDYTGASVEGRLEQTWGKAYNLIANTNLIIKNCEENRDVLSDSYHDLIKGEALGLRAMLHFDLFRLFGPVYSTDSTLASIPYYTEFVLNVAPSLSGEFFMDNVISDLRQAEILLGNDPIIKYGVKGDISDEFLQNRNFRLNYYAVQSLLSRAYMYTGQKDSALYYANKVIEIQETVFPWVKRENAMMGTEPDKVFSSEVIFALENRSITGLYSRYFDAATLKASSLLGLRTDVLEYQFDYATNTDYRYATSLKGSAIVNGVEYRLFTKYQNEVTDSIYSKMMPLIRVSELYLNAAEVMLDDDYRESIELYNVLLTHRGLEKIPSYYMDLSYIEDEYYKEFLGEGQLFFFYKRTGAESMRSATDPYGRTTVSKNKYVLPVPDAENKYN